MPQEFEVEGIRIRFAELDPRRNPIRSKLSHVVTDGATRPDTVTVVVVYEDEDGAAREEMHVFVLDESGTYVEQVAPRAVHWRPLPVAIGYWIADRPGGWRVVRVVSAGSDGFAVFVKETDTPVPLAQYAGTRWWGPIAGLTAD